MVSAAREAEGERIALRVSRGDGGDRGGVLSDIDVCRGATAITRDDGIRVGIRFRDSGGGRARERVLDIELRSPSRIAIVGFGSPPPGACHEQGEGIAARPTSLVDDLLDDCSDIWRLLIGTRRPDDRPIRNAVPSHRGGRLWAAR